MINISSKSKYIFLNSKNIYYRQQISRYGFSHVPVMAREIFELLKPEDGKIFIDMTFGAGGHSKCLLDSNKSIKIVAVDRDPVAFNKAQELAREIAIKSEELNINQSVIPIHGKFSTVIKQIHLSGIPYDSVHGIIFDLGPSSMQFDDPKRGFALSSEGILDMRMDPTVESDITAEDVVNSLSVQELSLIFKTFGGEKKSIKTANAIVDARTLLGRIKTTKELAKAIASNTTSIYYDALGRVGHPGTRVFQALRIFVNNEMNEINYALEKIRQFLIPMSDEDKTKSFDEIVNPYGIAAVLSFHSLEDTIVKRHFTGNDPNEPAVKSLSQHARIRTTLFETMDELDSSLNSRKYWKPIWKHVKKPSREEIESNPRSRSAKLRAAVRIV